MIGCHLRVYNRTSPHSFTAQLGHLYQTNNMQYIFKLHCYDGEEQLMLFTRIGQGYQYFDDFCIYEL